MKPRGLEILGWHKGRDLFADTFCKYSEVSCSIRCPLSRLSNCSWSLMVQKEHCGLVCMFSKLVLMFRCLPCSLRRRWLHNGILMICPGRQSRVCRYEVVEEVREDWGQAGPPLSSCSRSLWLQKRFACNQATIYKEQIILIYVILELCLSERRLFFNLQVTEWSRLWHTCIY